MSKSRSLSALVASFLVFASSALADVTVAFWAENNNRTPANVFGFTPDSFPQKADLGEGQLSLVGHAPAVGEDGLYTTIKSFAGDILNSPNPRQFPGGGSLSIEAGPNTINNGASIQILVSTQGRTGLTISWAQRGTATGFTSRVLSYSLDGQTFTPLHTCTGALGSDWNLRSYDLSEHTQLNDKEKVWFRITVDGATRASGNNRFDNILITAAR
jgi:hypothetical protein